MMPPPDAVTVSQKKLQSLEAVAVAAAVYRDNANDDTWQDLLNALERWEYHVARSVVDEPDAT